MKKDPVIELDKLNWPIYLYHILVWNVLKKCLQGLARIEKLIFNLLPHGLGNRCQAAKQFGGEIDVQHLGNHLSPSM